MSENSTARGILLDRIEKITELMYLDDTAIKHVLNRKAGGISTLTVSNETRGIMYTIQEAPKVTKWSVMDKEECMTSILDLMRQGMKQQQIAEALGTSQGTISQRVKDLKIIARAQRDQELSNFDVMRILAAEMRLDLEFCKSLSFEGINFRK